MKKNTKTHALDPKDAIIKNLIDGILISEFSRVVDENVTKILLSSKIKQDLDLDSLEVLEVIMSMEDLYKVSINNHLMNFKAIVTVGDLSAELVKRLSPPVESI